MLTIILKIYGIDTCRISSLYKFLSKFYVVFMHLIPAYLALAYILLHLYYSMPIQFALGCVAASVFPLAIHHSIRSKKHLLNNVLTNYYKINSLQNITRNTNKRLVANLLVAGTALITMLFATMIAMMMASNPLIKPAFSLFINFEDDVLGISVCFIVIQIMHIYQFAFPVFAGIMCGFFYYEFGEIFLRFRKELKCKGSSFYRDDILSSVKMYSSLYQLVHDLQNAVSLPCFFFLCTLLTDLFCTIASFVITWEKHVSAPHLCETVLIITLAIPSVVGTVLCGSRINTQYQKTQTAIVLLKDRLIKQAYYDETIVCYLNLMMDKEFPIMSACGIVQLTPNFMLGMFGSLFTYSLLILNLKK
ncbi:hypothetical protein AVEN_74525-1 [Araneus ventricosus]|uniref:Gustatory receptor n=1 Tax=Araneus ventricosus TaxID=182803 RepID=A0A4Y2GS55_ARAVE|nr:hypothetical protein AVEN_74525-1 [Araneus ventricosus]